MLAGSAIVAACGSTPRPSVSRTPTASPTAAASTADSPRPTPPLILGGYRWTPVDTGQFGGAFLEAVTATRRNSLLAIGGLDATAPDGTPWPPTAWTSVGGSAWDRLPDSSAFVAPHGGWREFIAAIVASGDGFVAVGLEGLDDGSSAEAAAWFSPDGNTWARATVPDGAGATMDQVVVTDHGFVALGEAGYSIHAGFGDGTAIWTSPDGRAWTRLATAQAPPHGTRLRSVVQGPMEFLAAASFENSLGLPDTPRPALTAGIWRSADAVHWAPIPGTPLGVRDIVRVADGFVALGSSDPGDTSDIVHPIAWRSGDGRSWVKVEVPLPNGLPVGAPVHGERLVSGAAGLLAFGERGDDSTVGWSSPDGAAWTPLDLTAILDGARIDEAQAVGGSLLVRGRRSIAGVYEPVVWLLGR
jgi:hypothetical protein